MNDITSAVQVVPLNYYIVLSIVLFSIGVIGMLLRRNAIIAFMSIELMLNAVNLLMVAFSSFRGDSSGQVFVFFIMVVANASIPGKPPNMVGICIPGLPTVATCKCSNFFF